jgi:hypothetical protein
MNDRFKDISKEELLECYDVINNFLKSLTDEINANTPELEGENK